MAGKEKYSCSFCRLWINLIDVLSNAWSLVTGATIDITNSLQEFRNSRELNKRELMVHMGKRVKARVKSIRVVKLHLTTWHFLDLLNTAYIPSIMRNLIYVSILDRCEYTFHFGDIKIYLFRNSELAGSNTLYDSLYMIYLFSYTTESSSNAHVMNVFSLIMWELMKTPLCCGING